jgi:gluconolactonase
VFAPEHRAAAPFVVRRTGEVTQVVRSPVGQTITNAAFHAGASELVLTDSEKGNVLVATLPGRGARLFSHA